MKCPNDQSEMEKGYLMNNGQTWSNVGPLLSWGQDKVHAYKCLKCGKVELTTQEQKEN